MDCEEVTSCLSWRRVVELGEESFGDDGEGRRKGEELDEDEELVGGERRRSALEEAGREVER